MKRRSAHLRLDGLEESVRDLRRDLSEVKEDVAVLKTDVAGLKTDVAVLKTDVAVLKTDVAGLKTDVAVLKTDVAGLKTDVAEIKTNVASLMSSQLLVTAQLDRLQRTIIEGFTQLAQRAVDEQDARVNAQNDHEERISILENRVDRLERDK